MRVETILRDYADLQARLCNALFERHPVEDVTKLRDLPRRGAFVLEDDEWEFSQRGIGVCFTRVAAEEIINARAWVFAYPAGFDACRLVEYFESKHITAITHGETRYDATRERSLARMLTQLCREGLLMLVDKTSHIYMLNDNARGSNAVAHRR
jgi:hypothetical protein